MAGHILFAMEFDGKGGGTELEGERISQMLEDKRLAWVHLDATHQDSKVWLEKELDYLDPNIIKNLVAEETRPRMLQLGDGVLLNLRGVNLNENNDPDDMVSIRLWVDNHRIVSLYRRKLWAVHDIKQCLEQANGPANAGDFVSLLTERLFERMEPILSELTEETDTIEDSVFDKPDSQLRERIGDLRRKATMFRRNLEPQTQALKELQHSDLSWLSDTNKRQLQEMRNHASRYLENLEAVRERAQIARDELANALADTLNKNTYMFSILASIFLPLGFLTGLLGINVGGIPGSESPSAFWIFIGLLIALIIAQLLIFKKLKWL